MNTSNTSEAAPAFEEVKVQELSGSSEPGSGSAAFTPVATAPKYTMTRWPNVVERTSEQRLLDYNREYERTVAFYEAADDANDLAQDAAAREETENALAHAGRMLKEIRENAYLVPARSIREVALKARIMSRAKAEFWDPTNSQLHDADIRFLVEDVLALGSLDRIKPRSFAFDDLMPGYAGPAREEPSDASLRAPQAPSFSENRKPVVTAAEDAAVIQAANELRQLSLENDAIWSVDPQLADDNPQQTEWKVKADAAFDNFEQAVAHLASLEPQTPVGLAAKASAAPPLMFLSYFLKDWCEGTECDLLLSILADAQRIGGGLASKSVPSRAGTDQPQVEQAA